MIFIVHGRIKMKIKLNKITGLDDAIISMYESKRTLTEELEAKIRLMVRHEVNDDGQIEKEYLSKELDEMFVKLFKWGKRHFTMLRFINLSITVYGLHRGGMDDLDAHAQRMNNRIIRTSTRLGEYKNEKSEFYEGKILTLDDLIERKVLTVPEKIEVDGKTYVKAVNGYVLEGLENEKDVLRGLFPLCIPMGAIININLTEYSHIYKERNENGNAHPELKKAIESLTDQLIEKIPYIDRKYLMDIIN